jgi:hypothetical protein
MSKRLTIFDEQIITLDNIQYIRRPTHIHDSILKIMTKDEELNKYVKIENVEINIKTLLCFITLMYKLENKIIAEKILHNKYNITFLQQTSTATTTTTFTNHIELIVSYILSLFPVLKQWYQPIV